MSNDSNKNIPFGKHVMLDLYNCPPKLLNDKSLVLNILKTLPEEIGMKILLEPIVAFAQPNGKRDPGGWSGFVMIQESHISVHTFIKRRFVTIDVYSCKDFDDQYIVKYFKKTFKTEDAELEVNMRGERYPQEDTE